jgi:CRISPR-associated protein Csd2
MNNRYDFVLLFEARDANPNGDPDAGNMPRVDTETNQGLVTDVCLKRKIRNFVQLTQAGADGFDIFVKEKAVLNEAIERPYRESDDVKKAVAAWDTWRANKKLPKPERAYEDIARDWLCEKFYDIRTFGAVLSTGDEKDAEGSKSKIKMTAGQVRGPVQLSFARSIDPIFSAEHSITRMAVTNEKDLEKERTMGRKFTVPYALYRAHGFINPFLAAQTGFTDTGEKNDLDLLREAIGKLFDFDASTARPAGSMAARRCIAFKHATALGNAPAHKLFEAVKITKNDGVDAPRSYSDYTVTIDAATVPSGVTVEEWV